MTVSVKHYERLGFKRVEIPWTSDAAGAASVVTPVLQGTIRRVVTDPAAAPNAPTDNYDATLLDEFGADLFAGQGADRDTANTEQFCPGISLKDGVTTSVVPIAVAGTATLTITNAGNTKQGTVILYLD